jgi:hypothetical protein
MSPREHWPAPERNKQPILDILKRVFPAQGTVLEIASGSGQHAAYFSAALAGLQWQPTEHSETLLSSIDAWAADGFDVLPAIALNVTTHPWRVPLARYDALFNANMVHIAPFQVCEGLFRGAAEHLVPAAPLVMYGPFKIDGRHTAESNAAFDQRLRNEDATWGVRDLDEVTAVAKSNGFLLRERVEMPANNQSLVFGRA